MNKHRTSGILLHVSSLPSRHGIGTFGKAAYDFVDFLSAAGQSHWQILPLGPTGYGDSPYQSFSTFAGNPYFIDLDTLCSDGLLSPEDYDGLPWGSNPQYVDFALIYQVRFAVLHAAYDKFCAAGACGEYEDYCRREACWLDDYAMFMALKSDNGGSCWREWETPLRMAEPQALANFSAKHSADIGFWKFLQYQFSRQWSALKGYANGKGISIIGDLPIYVADDSSDVWASPELFDLDEERRPRCVAGVPPDYFTENGQLWGNPVYDWDMLRADGFRWWISRLRSCREKYDILRIDHFRGFAGYYCVPYGAETAKDGVWKKGPGMELFDVVKSELAGYPIIAEDLGFLTPDVREMLDKCGFPGMKLLEFAFGADDVDNENLPHNLKRRCVCYPGTHDNFPIAGWVKSIPGRDRALCEDYMDLPKGGDFTDAFIRMVLGTVAETAVIPMQDWLGLDASARMNEPSTSCGNWQWRLLPGQYTPELAERIRHLTGLYGRTAAAK